ncbi:choice-of-anchor D domain-containing protein [Nostoc sp. CHAB 5834]|nr:choice-of-anchor D domain-containing protein [Nostoc sp. CHAB 5834]
MLNQGQQVLAAADLHKSDTGGWPVLMTTLTTKNYLRAIPEGSNGQAWTMPKNGIPVFILREVGKETCKTVNKLAFKVDGVFTKLSESYSAQCFSPQSETYIAVVSKEGHLLRDGECVNQVAPGIIPGTQTLCAPLPQECDDPGWSVKPSRCNSDGPSDGPSDPNPPINPDPEDPPTAGVFSLRNVPVVIAATQVGNTRKVSVPPELINGLDRNVTIESIWADHDQIYVEPGSCPQWDELEPNMRCSPSITYTPTTVGPTSVSVQIGTSEGVYTFEISAQGIPNTSHCSGSTSVGNLSINCSNVVFTDTLVGETSLAATAATITNNGDSWVALKGASTDRPEFAQSSNSSDCGSSTSLPPGATCNVQFQFTPVAQGLATDSWSLSTDEGTVSVSLTGRGIRGPVAVGDLTVEHEDVNYATLYRGTVKLNSAPPLEVNRTYDQYRNLTVVDTTPPVEFVVKNHSTVPLDLLSYHLPEWEGAVKVTYNVDSSDCPAQLQPSAQCRILVNARFMATDGGELPWLAESYTSELKLSAQYRKDGELHVARVTGKLNMGAEFGVEDNFGKLFDKYALVDGIIGLNVPPDVVGAEDDTTFHVVNFGKTPLPITIESQNSGMVATLGDNCSAGTIPAQAKCAIRVRYTRAPGDTVGRYLNSFVGNVGLRVSSTVFNVQLTGHTNAFYLMPSVVSFGQHALGSAMNGTTRLHNVSRIPISVYPVAGASNPEKFSFGASHTCSAVLEPGDSCEISFTAVRTYTPTKWYEYFDNAYVFINMDSSFLRNSGGHPYVDYFWTVWTTSETNRINYTGSPSSPGARLEKYGALNLLSAASPLPTPQKVSAPYYASSCATGLSVNGHNNCVKAKVEEAGLTCKVLPTEESWRTPGAYQTRLSCLSLNSSY